MTNFWWMQPGWTDALCGQCGQKIWPEGDPDHGVCYQCFMHNAQAEEHEQEQQRQAEERMAEEHFRKHPHG